MTYQYTMNWPVYAIDWAESVPGYLLLGSFIEDNMNQIQVIKISSQEGIQSIGSVGLDYPATQIQWKPGSSFRHLFAHTGDGLYLWNIQDHMISTLTILKQTSHLTAAPMTSLDWNPIHHDLVVTGSIDTTCVIWNIERQMAQAQLMAHDREVFDVTFLAQSANLFVSSGAEGSLRLFDLRSLEHSTILYETTLHDTTSDELLPLLRVSANTQNQ
ncbi:hypothetical protein PCK1_003189, partial [Pneumocystis canis]